MKNWEHFPHEADIGIRGQGPTIEAAFEMAAIALINVVSETKNIGRSREIRIQCSAPDLELLFVDWINAIIYEIDCQNLLFSQFSVKIHNLQLKAKLKGEPIERIRHQPIVGIKGATYTELRVHQEKNGWIAQCVVDV